MAKIDCPACNAKISLREDTCPHCGESLEAFVVRNQPRGENVKDAGLIVLSLCIFVWLVLAVTKSHLVAYVLLGVFLVGIILLIIARFMNLYSTK